MPGTRRRYAARLTTVLTAAAVGLGLAIVPGTPASAVPGFTKSTVVSGLEIPWDLTWVGSRMLYTLRKGEVWAKNGSAAPRRILDLRSQTYANGEGGLLGIVADPEAANTFYTCGSYKIGDDPIDVRVRRWVLNGAGTSASGGAPVVGALPITTGRHTGCRLRFNTEDGYLYVGTGDAAVGTNPQNLNSLGGKVLRVDGLRGGAPTSNPFYSRGGYARYVWTYGHRNIQGLALRPGTSELWTAEHGPDEDDEANRIVRGGNYGWNPVPGYNESVPMTDTNEYPSAQRAVWETNSPTLATSGLTFLTGSAWGRMQGAMAVALLKDRGINIVTLNPGGGLARVEKLAVVEGDGDRIRTVQQGPDGSLYYTTSNSSGNKIMKLTPRPERPLPTYRAGLDVSPVGVATARTTGGDIYVFVRSTGNLVYFKRSTDDGLTWGGWIGTGVQSTSAPAVTSSDDGRIDLITRSATNSAVHTWFDDGVREGQVDLGGVITAAPAVTSLSDGTLDVFVRGQGSYAGFRNRYASGDWSGWQSLGGSFTSALSASANRSARSITVTGRGTGGGAHARVVRESSNGSGWPGVGLLMWSGRALADQPTAAAPVGVHVGADGNAVVDRGGRVQGVVAGYDSFPAVVTRPNGTWIMFGRASSNGQLYLYDARSGGYRNVSLGGTVR